jgi:hypothetical protein
MTYIRVNPEQLQASAQALAELAEHLIEIERQIRRAAEVNGRFRSDFNPKLRPIRTSLCPSITKSPRRTPGTQPLPAGQSRRLLVRRPGLPIGD